MPKLLNMSLYSFTKILQLHKYVLSSRFHYTIGHRLDNIKHSIIQHLTIIYTTNWITTLLPDGYNYNGYHVTWNTYIVLHRLLILYTMDTFTIWITCALMDISYWWYHLLITVSSLSIIIGVYTSYTITNYYDNYPVIYNWRFKAQSSPIVYLTSYQSYNIIT